MWYRERGVHHYHVALYHMMCVSLLMYTTFSIPHDTGVHHVLYATWYWCTPRSLYHMMCVSLFRWYICKSYYNNQNLLTLIVLLLCWLLQNVEVTFIWIYIDGLVCFCFFLVLWLLTPLSTIFQLYRDRAPSCPWSYGSWIYNYLCNQCLSPLKLCVRISIRARCTTLCDKVCQWLAIGRWFSPGTPVSPINKTDLHDITEILLKIPENYSQIGS
jgi:hypothetical protein